MSEHKRPDGTSAKIIADSISPAGIRLTTLECVYPRIIHAEMMTHRQFSRNAASSRAIPVEKMIRMVQDNPYIPSHWGKNQKGMQAEEELSPQEQAEARAVWTCSMMDAVQRSQALLKIGVHKQLTNRLLEPFLWYTCLITATEWDNFFHLRCHPAAHPEMRAIAEAMRDARDASVPKQLSTSEWHLPYIRDEDYESVMFLAKPTDPLWVQSQLKKISVARCARLSYLTQDGKRDYNLDVELHDRLLVSGHMSPFEHVARPMTSSSYTLRKDIIGEGPSFCGNFDGWIQYRKTIPHEHDILSAKGASS